MKKIQSYKPLHKTKTNSRIKGKSKKALDNVIKLSPHIYYSNRFKCHKLFLITCVRKLNIFTDHQII